MIVLGKGRLANYAAHRFHASSDHKLVAVIPSLPESPLFESLTKTARRLDVPILPPERLKREPPVDLLVCSSYNRILGRDELARHQRAVNFHFSKLPNFRGVRPINWAMETGATSHGVTLHLIDEGIDTGAILDQEEVQIRPEVDEVIDVYFRCVDAGRLILDRNIQHLTDVEPVRAASHTAGSYYSLKDAERLARFAHLSSSTRRIQECLPL